MCVWFAFSRDGSVAINVCMGGFNKILLLFLACAQPFSYSTIAVVCILKISGAKNSYIVI